MKRCQLWFIAVVCVFSGCRKEEETPEFGSLEEEVDFIMGKYVKMGAALGIIDQQQEVHTWFYGSLSKNRPQSPDTHSLFEIGSISKTFTNTLLAKKVLEERVSLDDPAQDYLPSEEVTLPTWEGTAVRLRHLATHASGIPRVPRESRQPLPPGYDPNNPYDAYETSYVYGYLNNYCFLEFEPGTAYLYSNTGGGLLGHLLGLEDGSSYAALLEREILTPLGMQHTTLDLDSGDIAYLAPGHNDWLDSVANYTAYDIFEGAGFIKSSLEDMLIYLKANMGIQGDVEAFEFAQQPQFEVGDVTYSDRDGVFNLSVGLGWHIHTVSEDDVYCYHGGRTNGYMAFMSFDSGHRNGFVVLFNHSVPEKINRIGEELRQAIRKYE